MLQLQVSVKSAVRCQAMMIPPCMLSWSNIAALTKTSHRSVGFVVERPSLRDRKFVDSLLEGAGFEPSVPRESNGEKAKKPVSLVERKMPEMFSTGRKLSIFTSGFSRD
jgi:hypothetical protein